MKRILSTLCFVLLLTVLTIAQDKTASVILEGDTTVSVSFNVPTGYTLTGVNIPTMTAATTAIILLVSINGSTYDTLFYDGKIYSEVIVASGCNLSFQFQAVHNWSKFKFAVNTEQTSTRTLRANFTKKY